jgi:membrane protease subunit HflC
MKNPLFTTLAIITVIIMLLVFLSPLYIIHEGEQAVIIRFGQIVNVNQEAGLKFKIPLIDSVQRFPKRIMSWDGEPQLIPTAENQFIWVDTTARWRITDPELFYERITTLSAAYGRLDDVIDSAVRAVISENSIAEAVRSSNEINEQTAEELLAETSEVVNEISQDELLDMISVKVNHDPITKGRSNLSDVMLENSREDVADFGIELIDVVIRQIRYSDEMKEAVFNRMISERNQIAEGYRAIGEGKRQDLLGQLERERETILSEAEAQAQEIRARADAQAAQIYNAAYSRNQSFFELWRTLESYRRTLPNMEKTLSTDMEYFRFLYSPQG